jgi:hypothetical protein
MRKLEANYRPPSLAQHFEAPDEWMGCFGWLCGFSADSGFLDDAVERFIRRTHPQRAYEGRVALAVMLDPSNPQITPKEVPGALHLPISGAYPFRLLHAKVALLGFRHISEDPRWRVRLLVSTGNWTRQTLEDSLDLVWRVDLCDDDLREGGADVSQDCADVAAAWSMLDWLGGHFDTRAIQADLPDRPESDSAVASRRLESWLRDLSALGHGVRPRFVDNRAKSFLGQLPELVRLHGSSTARNYLAMGSGFYESADDTDAIPSVLRRVVDNLKHAQLLTRSPEVDVFVNPKACQAVATSRPALERTKWRVREAGMPAYFKPTTRSLHAKFIFSATYRDNSDLCNSAWLYLGSGNLTGPGFANAMHPESGNLEAGVVFAPALLRWYPEREQPADLVVTNVLPLQWEQEVDQFPGALLPGTDMPDPEVRFSAPPVAYFWWSGEEHVGWLRSTDMETQSFDVLDGANEICPRDNSKGFRWLGSRPREVRVRWVSEGHEIEAWVPVLDEFGRIGATILPGLDIEDAWGQLANFPMPPDEEEIPADGDGQAPDESANKKAGAHVTAKYPIRQMMEFIENIAAMQTTVKQSDWAMWCTRLEQCLTQAAGSPVVEEFVKLDLNPISPLWHAPFRPEYALTIQTPEGRRYEEVLTRVAAAWDVGALVGWET